MILIIAADDDAHVPFVTKHLDARHVEYRQFDPARFPSVAEISVRHDSAGTRSMLLRDRETALDLSRVRSVWHRGRARPVADPNARPDQRWWIAESSARFLSELYECMECFWLPERPRAERNPFSDPLDSRQISTPIRPAAASAYNKLYQLEVANRNGFSVPRTLVTNSPDRFLEFFESCGGRMVSKRVIGNLLNERDGEMAFPYTHAVRRRDAGGFQAVRYAPVILQEVIQKQLELRVTVVGRKVFASAIRSQDNTRLLTDWRHSRTSGFEDLHTAHALADDVSARCVRIVEELGLCFGAIDLIVTPDGDHVFLEVNPNGQWAWVEEFTNLPIGDAIAELLTTRDV
jgi:hypothetical protein